MTNLNVFGLGVLSTVTKDRDKKEERGRGTRGAPRAGRKRQNGGFFWRREDQAMEEDETEGIEIEEWKDGLLDECRSQPLV